ncbi:MAG: glycosyltransferase family 2 protein, partial [Rhodobacteraceae bacterium]|nr:glycosyltransferase family 2 protein [Paracoccaceae bacterium]
RTLGIQHFLIVDDRSTDGTSEILDAASDVTVFVPETGSSYREHKRFWRAELLDTYCTNLWCVVPDIDEHLIYKASQGMNLHGLTCALEAEGANAVQATMIDMYSDAPLDQVSFSGGNLHTAFPFFDGPEYYFRLAKAKRFHQKYPTPFFMVTGGVRQRMFFPIGIHGTNFNLALFRKMARMDGTFVPDIPGRISAKFARRLIKARSKKQLLNMTKIPLVCWQKGAFFSGGAHSLSGHWVLSREKAALLHYNFASGVSGVAHKVARGEHMQRGAFYAQMLDDTVTRSQSPVFEGTMRYQSPRSLDGFLGKV